MFPSNEYDNERAIAALVKSIGNDRPVLLVGAGCSVDLGYPGLDQLLGDVQRDLLITVPADTDRLRLAQSIRTRLTKDGRVDDYYNYLERAFSSKLGQPGHSRLHSVLARLPFCGRATTNYDFAVESALSESHGRLPQTIDFCRARRHDAFAYLRRLGSASGQSTAVLHLHGCYDNPEHIILTQEDYLHAYGPEVEVEYKRGSVIKGSLDMPHRKVLWTLLVMHPVVFVGFSLDDPAFKQMLEVVQGDFSLGSDQVHLAIVDWRPTDDLVGRISELRRRNITPVFYEVRPNSGDGKYTDHRELEGLLLGVARELGIEVPPLKLSSALDRMIDLVRDED